MTIFNTTRSFGSLSKTLHWLTASSVIMLFPLGFAAQAWDHASGETLATKAVLFSLHKTLGVAVFFMALARLVLLVLQPHPGPLHPERRIETKLAQTTHVLLYLSLVAVPATGYLHHAATTGFAPIWWPGPQTLAFVPQSAAFAQLMATMHSLFAMTLAATIFLHVTGALKHHIIDRDATLRRMLPCRADAQGGAQGDNQGDARQGGPEPAPTARDHSPALLAAGIYVAIGVTALVASPGRDSDAPSRAILAFEQEVDSPRETAQMMQWQVLEGAIDITVKQFGAPVTGSFSGFAAEIVFDEASDANGRHGHISVAIDVASLQIGSVTAQARGADFLDADNHPRADFIADIFGADGNGFVARGTLSLAGAEVPVELPFSLAHGDDVALAQGSVVVDRRDFGIGLRYDDERTVGFAVEIGVRLQASRR